MSTTIKLQIEGGNATPGPPVATALGSRGVNTRDFCLQFNALTQAQKGRLLRVLVTVYPDKRFKIEIKGVPAAIRIKEMAKVSKGASEPKRSEAGTITTQDVAQLIEEMGDNLAAFTEEAKRKTIEGTARSMGIRVIQ